MTPTETTGVKFQINNAKRYVSVVTLSINDNIKLLKNIKQGFKRTISWSKYKSEITAQTKNNNLDYLIDPTVRKIKRSFALSFKNSNDDSTRDFCDDYYSRVSNKRPSCLFFFFRKCFNPPAFIRTPRLLTFLLCESNS